MSFGFVILLPSLLTKAVICFFFLVPSILLFQIAIMGCSGDAQVPSMNFKISELVYLPPEHPIIDI